MTTHLRGRVGVVTAAGNGIGLEIATGLAGEGMSLLLIDPTGARVRALADQLSERFDVRCLPAAVDIGDQAAIDRIVMHAEQQLGAVDLLVTAADGPQLISQTLLPTMRARGRGHVVNIVGDGTIAATLAGSGVVIVDVPAADDAALVVADVARGRYDGVVNDTVSTPPRP